MQFLQSIKNVILTLMMFSGVVCSASAQNKTPVSTKTYEKILKGADNEITGLTFRFFDTDNDPGTIEEVRAMSEDMTLYIVSHKLENVEVVSVNNYAIELVGADGKSVGTLRHSQLELRGAPNAEGRRKYTPIANETIVKEMTEFANTGRNHGAIKIKNITNTLYGRYNSWPADFAKPATDWMAKTMQENYTFGTPAGTRHLTTSIGKYTMDVYTSDKNDEDFETLVFTRDDGFRFKLDQLRIMNLKVVAEETYDDTPLPLACIDISWPNVGKFSIFDNELAVELMKLAQSKEFAKAVNMKTTNVELKIGSNGSFLKK